MIRPLLTIPLLASLLLIATPAEACGWWWLEDLELKWRVVFFYHAIDVKTAWNGKGHPPRRRLLYSWKRKPKQAIAAVDWRVLQTWGTRRKLAAKRGKKLLFRFPRRGELTDAGGKRVGTWGPKTVTIGSTRYDVAIRTRFKSVDQTIYAFEVKRGRKTIISTAATSFCSDQKRDDVLERLSLYLAWRQLLRPSELAPKTP